MFVPAQARADMVARPSEPRIVGKHLATCLKLLDVTRGLGSVPFTNGELGNPEQIGLGAARQSKLGHAGCTRRSAWQGKLELHTDTPKNIPRGDSARVAFINGRPQRCQLQFVSPLLLLQRAQAGTHDLACVFIASALNLGGDEAVKFGCQIDVASRHGIGPFRRQNKNQVPDSRIMIAQLAKIANRKQKAGPSVLDCLRRALLLATDH